MEEMRRPLQGTWNIIRFNWHFYLLSFGLLLLLFLLTLYGNETFRFFSTTLFWIVGIPTLLSLLISLYIYDLSGLYKLGWLNGIRCRGKSLFVNIHAGFDETSVLLKERFKNAELLVFDFFDPVRHTEVSIKRARKAYPPSQDAKQVNTTELPLKDGSADNIFVLFSAHEIREEEERQAFFKELNRILKSDGQIIVTEHLRDGANFLAYNIGFFHFYSEASWLKTFQLSELRIHKEFKITPFISTFILVKHGDSF